MQWQELRSHIRHLPARDIARIEKAFQLGKKMHEGQNRRSGEPYFSHPIAVALMLLDLKADTDTIIAALLHDTVEDTSLTLQDIDHDFDGSVAALIDGVTKLSSKDVAMSPKLDEQIETLRKIFTLMQEDVRIMIIKLIDRLHNMQTIEFLPLERQRLLAKETAEVFVKIADRLCMQDLRDELESLCLAVLEPESYSSLQEIRNANEQRSIYLLESIRETLRTHDRILGSKTDLVFEYKTWDQIKAQRNIGTSAVTGASFITIAFVCDDIDACYRILGALHQLWKRETLSFQDFINEPQLNGYQGIHTTIIAQDGTRVRCKIRTKEMHQYARSGIATKCFDSKAMGIADYLPWTKNLSSITSDSAGSSNEFWENLKSDILGDTIIIHGPGDSTVQLPRNSTALDGAFFLRHEKALCTVSIKLNGIDVPFSAPLTNAASLDVQSGTNETCNREWLRLVQSGYAAAKIREALMKMSDKEKRDIGREMLQQILTENKRGFIEEFEEVKLASNLEKLGYRSLDEVYESIADGRLEPDIAYINVFQMKRGKGTETPPPAVIVSYVTDMNSLEKMDKLNVIHRSYGTQLKDIHYRRHKSGLATVSLRVNMHTQYMKGFLESLVTAGAEHPWTRSPIDFRIIVISVVLVLLWGMDAIFTKLLLNEGVSVAAFTLIRSWAGVGFACVAFLLARGSRSLLRIPIFHPLLWVSGIAFFFVNLLTNATLAEVTPFFYKTSLRISAPLLALPLLLNRKFPWQNILCLALLGAGLFVLFQNAPQEKGLLLSLCMVIAFVIYTKSSTLFQARAHISVRYPQFFLMISIISALLSPVVFFFGPVVWPSSVLMIHVIAFTIGFVCVPYILFYYLHHTMGYGRLSPFFHVSIIVTFVMQWFLLGIFDGAIIIPCIAFILSSALSPTPSSKPEPL